MVEHDAAGVGADRLLLEPALLEELGAGLRRSDRARFLPALARASSQDRLVEVVAAEAGLARAGDHLVHLPRHVDERAVEGAAAEVVDQHVLALAGDRAAEAVRVLEPGRGGLVQERQHLEAGAAEGVEGEEALVVGGVGGHADRDLERLARRARPRSSAATISSRRRVKWPARRSARSSELPADLDPRQRAGVGEEALEGPQDRPVRRPAPPRPRRCRSGRRRPRSRTAASDGMASPHSYETTG